MKEISDTQLDELIRDTIKDSAEPAVGDCPDEDAMIDYLQIPLEERDPELDRHFATCGKCLRALVEMHKDLELFHKTPPLRKVPRKVWKRFALATGILPARLVWALRPAYALALVVVVFVGGFLSGHGRSVALERMQDPLIEGYKDANALRERMSRAQSEHDVAFAADRVEVFRAAGNGKEYWYPTWGRKSVDLKAIAEGSQHASLKPRYDEYLKEWTDIFLELSDILVQRGKLDGAMRVFQCLTNAHPDDKSFWFALGELYKINGQHREAIDVYEQMIKRGLADRDPRPWNFAGWSYFESGEYDKALECYNRALEVFPDYAKCLYNRALVFKAVGKTQFYKRDFQRALALTLNAYRKEGDTNPRVPFSLAVLSVEKGETEAAISYLKQALQQDRTYAVRMAKERAFVAHSLWMFSSPYYSKFRELHDRYLIPGRRFSMRLEKDFNPGRFSE